MRRAITPRDSRDMKRHLTILAFCLLAGAAINVLVAWAIAVTDDPDKGPWDFYSDGPDPDRLAEHPLFPDAGPYYGIYCRKTTRWSSVSSHMRLEPGRWPIRHLHDDEHDGVVHGGRDAPFMVTVIDSGWPARSMRAVEPIQMTAIPTTVAATIDSIRESLNDYSVWLVGIESPFPAGNNDLPMRIPLRPLLRGTLLNTMVYGLLVWLLVSIPLAILCVHRRRRGRCVKCGYQLADLPTCPECGSAA